MHITSDKTVIQLHPSDNVVITIQALAMGSSVSLHDTLIPIEKNLAIGYKLANRNIQQGDKILKYGVSIGSATRDIRLGEVVHVHNMQSDYTATHILKETAFSAIKEQA
ncbi:UxaA family hydrolase [Thiolinea disciformis]|uniref:UxaA family hydrolase n=1 Tax=Thiolinea disciformis TaxID=125614 RepID=UPI0003774670|nr:UxaA family hydrolase [Thiolinea disciformis]